MPGVDCGGPRAKLCKVRFRDPPRGRAVCRTPGWAQRAARKTGGPGTKVTTCQYPTGWRVQRVMIPKPKKGKPNKKAIQRKATTIRNKIERKGPYLPQYKRRRRRRR